ncbi:unnamed protein product [Diamesa hyperborea]
MAHNKNSDAIGFTRFCAKMGCPQDGIPKESSLETLFRSKLCLVLNGLLQKVETKQHVDMVRKQILVNNILLIKDQTVLSTATSKFPVIYQNYVSSSKLQERIRETEKRVFDLKRQQKLSFENIQQKSIKKIQVDKTLSSINAKHDILLAKSLQLDTVIMEEKELDEKITSVTPAKLLTNGMKDDFVRSSIKNCIDDLKVFYEDFDSIQSDEYALKSIKMKLWTKLRTQLTNIPNSLVWAVLSKLLEENIEVITQYSAESTPELTSTNKTVEAILLPKLQTQHIIKAIELHTMKKKISNLKDNCADYISCFTDDLERQMSGEIDNSFISSDDDILGDYIEAFIKRYYVQGSIIYANTQIDNLKMDIEKNRILLSDFQKMIQDTKIIYDNIDEKVATTQKSVAQLYLIKDKLNFSKISMMHMLQSIKSTNNQQLNRTMMNQTIANNSNEMNNISSAIISVNIPKHINELQTFLETPLEKLRKTSWNLDYELNTNYLVEDVEILPLVILSGGQLLTLHGLLEEMKKNFELSKKLSAAAKDVEANQSLSIDINPIALKEQSRLNNEAINEFIDKISRTNVSTKGLLRKTRKYLDFSMKNPLRKFIPATKKFNGTTYIEYEAEFMMYYRMISS